MRHDEAAGRGGGRRTAARVVHVITLLELGGAQENTLITLERLDPERFDRVLVSGRGGALDARAARIPRCAFRQVGPLVRQVSPACDVRAFLALRSIFAREKKEAGRVPLIVHTHSSKAGILGRAAARAAGADVIVHSIHGFGFHDGQSFATRAAFIGLERLAARWTDAFIAVSRDNVRRGVFERIFPESRCRLIRSGFDTGRFLHGSRARGRELLGVPDGVPLVGTVAVFKPQKAPLDFVETARRVSGAVPAARFVMVGDGELRPQVEHSVAAARLSGRFILAGWRQDVPDLLAAFDVFLLTSRWEGLPKVVPQAILAGVPVVATAVDGTREIVDDGIDGFLAPPGDCGALSARVVAILTGAAKVDPGFKRDRIVREFDHEEMVRAQAALYRELLEAKGFRA